MPAPSRRLARALLVAACLGGFAGFAGAASAQEGWPMAGGDPAHSGTVDGPAPPYRVAWRAELGEGAASGVAATDDVLVALTLDGVLALDPADGSVIWERGRAPGPAGVPAISGGMVIHARDEGIGGQLVARDLAGGDIVWQANLGSAAAGGPTIAGDTVVAGTAGGLVVAMDLRSGQERWRFETRGRVTGAPAIGDEAVVAVAYEASSAQSTVYALDLASGRQSWRHTAVQLGPFSSASIVDGRAVVGASDFQVRAFDLAEGTERWSTPTRAGVAGHFGPRHVPAAGDPVLVADPAHLYALEPRTGVERWVWLLADREPVGDGRPHTLLASDPAMSGAAALIGSGDGTLSAIDVGSGLRVWRHDLGDGPVGPVAVTPERVYTVLFGEQGALVALEHDPAARPSSELSPAVFLPGTALLNFALAALAVAAALVLGFRYASRAGGPA